MICLLYELGQDPWIINAIELKKEKKKDTNPFFFLMLEKKI